MEFHPILTVVIAMTGLLLPLVTAYACCPPGAQGGTCAGRGVQKRACAGPRIYQSGVDDMNREQKETNRAVATGIERLTRVRARYHVHCTK
ncbi:MAG: hypothetical protein LIO46_04245 [Clostridiales bacterium]|nr:hypothetical protein [Clostridiales bacterium]